MKGSMVKDMTVIALFTAAICVCSFISIPILSVPVTMQSFAVFAALLTLGGKRGTASVFLYVAIGALGLPVFSGFSGGVGRLFDIGGGFIFGFMAAALLYLLITSIFGNSNRTVIVSAVSAHLLLYVLGAVWVAFVYSDVGIASALLTSVLPFLLPDAVKLALAFFVSKRLKKTVKI